MKLTIVGVGEVFDFRTNQMTNQLQVEGPQGQVVSIPASQETAEALIKLSLNGNGAPAVHRAPQQDADLDHLFSQKYADTDVEDDFPDGAEVFGEDAPPQREGKAETAQQLFARTQESRGGETPEEVKAKLGVSKNPADRSGIASYGIARVDEKGNPMLPPPPELDDDDDEEDPGEQI